MKSKIISDADFMQNFSNLRVRVRYQQDFTWTTIEGINSVSLMYVKQNIIIIERDKRHCHYWIFKIRGGKGPYSFENSQGRRRMKVLGSKKKTKWLNTLLDKPVKWKSTRKDLSLGGMFLLRLYLGYKNYIEAITKLSVSHCCLLVVMWTFSIHLHNGSPIFKLKIKEVTEKCTAKVGIQ